MVKYLDPALVQGKRQTRIPMSGQTRSGYGARLPSAWMLRIEGRWYRVRFLCYSNSGSPYIKFRGELLFLGSYDPND